MEESKHTPELLPCPKCLNKETISIWENDEDEPDGETHYKVVCANCYIQTQDFLYKGAAIKDWNTRAPEMAVQIEALQKEKEEQVWLNYKYSEALQEKNNRITEIEAKNAEQAERLESSYRAILTANRKIDELEVQVKKTTQKVKIGDCPYCGSKQTVEINSGGYCNHCKKIFMF